MNVYEEAHRLAQAVKESEEYKQFAEMQKIVDQKPETRQMIENLQRMQTEQQMKQMMGEDVGQELMQEIQSLMQIVAADPQAAQYLQVATRFGVMMQDVYKILGDVIDIGK